MISWGWIVIAATGGFLLGGFFGSCGNQNKVDDAYDKGWHDGYNKKSKN